MALEGCRSLQVQDRSDWLAAKQSHTTCCCRLAAEPDLLDLENIQSQLHGDHFNTIDATHHL